MSGSPHEEPRRTVTATSVLLAWRGCPADFAVDVLARQALQAIEERDTWRAMHSVTLAQLDTARVERDPEEVRR